MALKDTVARTVTKMQVFLEDEVWPDTYTVTREIYTPDDEGGGTTTEGVVESGPCRYRAYLFGSEAPVADRLGWTSAGAVDLPFDTTLTPSDALTINGRAFEVGVVSRDGNFIVSVRAIVREHADEG